MTGGGPTLTSCSTAGAPGGAIRGKARLNFACVANRLAQPFGCCVSSSEPFWNPALIESPITTVVAKLGAVPAGGGLLPLSPLKTPQPMGAARRLAKAAIVRRCCGPIIIEFSLPRGFPTLVLGCGFLTTKLWRRSGGTGLGSQGVWSGDEIAAVRALILQYLRHDSSCALLRSRHLLGVGVLPCVVAGASPQHDFRPLRSHHDLAKRTVARVVCGLIGHAVKRPQLP